MNSRVRKLVKDETAAKEAFLTFCIIDAFVNTWLYLKDICCFENTHTGLEILLLLLSRNEIPDERPWASFKHSRLTVRETTINQRKMKKVKRRKKGKKQREKKQNESKRKGNNASFPLRTIYKTEDRIHQKKR